MDLEEIKTLLSLAGYKIEIPDGKLRFFTRYTLPGQGYPFWTQYCVSEEEAILKAYEHYRFENGRN